MHTTNTRRLVKRGPLVPLTSAQSPTHANPAKRWAPGGEKGPTAGPLPSQRLSALAKPRHPPPPPPTSSSSSSAPNPHYLRKLSAPPPEVPFQAGASKPPSSRSRSRPNSSSTSSSSSSSSSFTSCAPSTGVFDKHVSVVLTATVTEANALAQAGALEAGLRLLNTLPDTLPSVRSKGLFWVAHARLQERQGKVGMAARTLAVGISACRLSPPAEMEVVVQALLGLALKGVEEEEEGEGGADGEGRMDEGEMGDLFPNENAGGLGGAGAPPTLASLLISSPTRFDSQSQPMAPRLTTSSVSASSTSSPSSFAITLNASTDATAPTAAAAAESHTGPRPSLPNLQITAFPAAPLPAPAAASAPAPAAAPSPSVGKTDIPSSSPTSLQQISGSGSSSEAAPPPPPSSSLSSSSSSFNPLAFSGMYADLVASTLGASGIRFQGMALEAALSAPPPAQTLIEEEKEDDTLPSTPAAPGLKVGPAPLLSPLPSSPSPITLASLQAPPPLPPASAGPLPPAAAEEGERGVVEGMEGAGMDCMDEGGEEDKEEEEEEEGEVLEDDLEMDSSSRCPPVFPIPVPVQMGSVVVLQTITARPSTAASLGGAPVFLSPVRRSVRAVRSALKADALSRLGGGEGGGKKGKAVSASEVKPKGSRPLTNLPTSSSSSSAPLVLAVSHPILREAMKAALNPSTSSSSSTSQGGRNVVFSPRGSRPVAGGRQDAALSSLTSASDAFAAQGGEGEGVSSASSSSSEGSLNAAGLAPPPFLGVSSSDRAALMALSPSSAPLDAISDMLSAAVAPVGTNTIEEAGYAFVPNPALPGVSLLRGHADAEEGEGGGMM